MIKVALIDSGMREEGELEHKCFGRTAIFKDQKSGKLIYHDNIMDLNGHGTYCANVITAGCQDVYFYVIKIVNQNGYTSSDLLYRALEVCLETEVKIICISLSVIRNEKNSLLEDILAELQKQEKIICVSVENGKESSFPACLPSVIGVKGKRYCSSAYFTYEKGMACFDSMPVLVQDQNGKYVFFGGNSKANAVCVGYIASLLKKNPAMTVRLVQQELRKNASLEPSKITTDELNNCLKRLTKEDAELFRRLVFCFNKKEIGGEFSCITPVISDETGIHMGNVLDFLETAGKELDFKIDYKKLSFVDIFYLGNFIKYIKGETE